MLNKLWASTLALALAAAPVSATMAQGAGGGAGSMKGGGEITLLVPRELALSLPPQ